MLNFGSSSSDQNVLYKKLFYKRQFEILTFFKFDYVTMFSECWN